MNVFEAVIQGIVQGLTEFLPVSSSGHLLLVQHVLGVRENNLFFNVMLHIGTLAAVLAVYYKTVWKLVIAFFEIIKNIFTGKFSLKKTTADQNLVIMLFVGLLPLFLLFAPLPGSEMSVKDVAEELAGDNSIIIVGIALIVTGILLKLGIKRQKSLRLSHAAWQKNADSLPCGRTRMNIMDAVSVGVTQFVAAIFPGLSRSGSTLSAGLLRGVNKQTALDYTFILAIPSIMAAAAVELKEAVEAQSLGTINIVPVAVGMIVSAIVGFLSIKLFKWLLKTDKMIIFVIYTFVVGAAAVIAGIAERCIGINIFTGATL